MRRIIPALFVLVSASAADPGVSPDRILVGQACALSGPAQGLGKGMQLGLRAWIERTNAAGGIGGRKIALANADDHYDAEKCADATVKLVEDDKVFCAAGFVGTPTTKAALPILTESKVPLIGAFTGAMLLRAGADGKPLPLVFNLRASYDDETEAIVAHFAAKKLSKIAVFHQNDAFGKAGLDGTVKALKKRGLDVVAKGTFERNTVAINKGMTDVLAGNPDAIVMVGPYVPVAAFLKALRSSGSQVPCATVSFVGTEQLIAEAGAQGEGVIIGQVVPSPHDAGIPLVAEYQAALKAVDPEAKPGYVSFEGYVTGRMLGLGLERAGAEPTRAGLVAGLEAVGSADLGGMQITLGPADHQGSDTVWLTRIAQGAAVTLKD
jgi:branched-chain amino acid transport system substrate-binding protein